ncbi:MAG: hypothetical protein AABN95_23905 [Acidobacteriota bacterium]
MAKHKSSVLAFFIISTVFGVILLSTLRTQSQGTAPIQQQQKEPTARTRQPQSVDTSGFPIVDYLEAAPADSKERARRKAKGEKYNRPEPAFAPHLVSVSDRYDWDENMPSLPVTESDAVIIGEVTSAEAYLSSDKTGIYSEFTIEICQILKNDTNTPLKFPGSVLVERTGGRVRFPSGQVGVMYVSNLGMPRVGRKYVLFLSHNFPYQVRRVEDYRILTGYELLDGRVVPLESSGVVNFEAHRGKDEPTFLAELHAALNK